jgi:hypothetical protein
MQSTTAIVAGVRSFRRSISCVRNSRVHLCSRDPGQDLNGRMSKRAAHATTLRQGTDQRVFPTNIPRQVKIVEVGPRDGLQNEPALISVGNKVELIRMLLHAGCSHVETGSFVSPKWVPSMANSAEVMKELQLWRQDNKTAAVFSCLVPNTAGLQLAIECGADEIAIFGSASEAFSHKVGLLVHSLIPYPSDVLKFSPFSHVFFLETSRILIAALKSQ